MCCLTIGGPGSAERFATHQYKNAYMRSIGGKRREHTYPRRTGPQNHVVKMARWSEMRAAIKMAAIETTKDTPNAATLPMIAINETLPTSLLPLYQVDGVVPTTGAQYGNLSSSVMVGNENPRALDFWACVAELAGRRADAKLSRASPWRGPRVYEKRAL